MADVSPLLVMSTAPWCLFQDLAKVQSLLVAPHQPERQLLPWSLQGTHAPLHSRCLVCSSCPGWVHAGHMLLKGVSSDTAGPQ